MTARCPRFAALVAAAAFSAAGGMAPSAKPAPAPTPAGAAEARQIIMNAIVAMDPAPYTEVKFSSYGTGSLKETTPRLEGKVRILARPKSRPPWVRVEADVIDPLKPAAVPLRLAVVTDGDNVTVLSEAEKTVWKSVKHRGGDVLFTAKSNRFLPAIADRMGLQGLLEYPASVEKETLSGAACLAVRFPLPGGGGYVYRFGAKDHLPRSFEWETVEKGKTGSLVLDVLSWIKPPVAPTSTFLNLTPVGNYETKEYTFGGPAVGEAAPAWSVTTSRGKELTLASFAGKVLVMDFWATWCGPCRASMPKLKDLSLKLRKSNLAVVGLTWHESGDAPAYFAKEGIPYPTFPGDKIAKAYGVDGSGIPTLFVIGPDGKVIDYFIGYAGDETDALLERTIVIALLGRDFELRWLVICGQILASIG